MRARVHRVGRPLLLASGSLIPGGEGGLVRLANATLVEDFLPVLEKGDQQLVEVRRVHFSVGVRFSDRLALQDGELLHVPRGEESAGPGHHLRGVGELLGHVDSVEDVVGSGGSREQR